MARFFINRPIVAMVISIVTVLLGVVAMSGLPIAQYPEIVPPMVQVTTTFVGASATDVEASVATPAEQKINGVENSIYMKSTNANDGTLTLKVSFDVSGAGAHERRGDLHHRRHDLGILRGRQPAHGHEPEQHRDDGNHHRDDRAVDEEARHGYFTSAFAPAA